MASQEYLQLLRDPRWQKKRLEVLSRDNFTCQSCFDAEKTLHVHHKKYRRGAKPWEYEETELLTLCEECHSWVTKERTALQDALTRFPDRLLPLLRGFVDAVATSEVKVPLKIDWSEPNFVSGIGLAVNYPDDYLVDRLVETMQETVDVAAYSKEKRDHERGRT